MAAAYRMGVPLSVARGARLPGEAWTRRDWALAQAVEQLDRLRCSSCGQPVWLGHDKALRKQWHVTVERCFSCDAISTRREQMGETQHPEALKFAAKRAI